MISVYCISLISDSTFGVHNRKLENNKTLKNNSQFKILDKLFVIFSFYSFSISIYLDITEWKDDVFWYYLMQ